MKSRIEFLPYPMQIVVTVLTSNKTINLFLKKNDDIYLYQLKTN